ncbi:YolD-like family protein [Sporolactobacillus shoreicorticis]|uniref:YolD-like family protein n=1 Tax=Sporolactobacillus shoreicorticis TaxID=1923877 RepID=A0ABW5RYV3_9BACL|nr:YolD-like family protein [Sporolactobacillus shoreicorticis]MCO7127913.1 YolD-like family protein [Sporolactobacillus shoreicorticis]
MNKLTEGSNMRWESMRMMLPEHIARIREEALNEQKILRPFLAEDELEQIGRTLQEAIKKRCPVELSYYEDGFIKKTICYPQRLNSINKLLIVFDAYRLKERYAFDDIMDVKSN